ncbi:MAG TPA: lytic transglycosylase domain-containing protein [Terriglobales bacterium]|nr:lytic transglycosylase domain-containing protein [Terriglobales bacterium]
MKRFLISGVLLLSAAAYAGDAVPATRTAYDAVLRNGFSIHHLRHEVVGDNTRLYTDDRSFLDVPTHEIAEMVESPEPLPAPELAPKASLNEVVSAASDKHQIDPDLIQAVIHAESGFNPNARSPKGAQGLMQLMPGTANQLGVADAYDPEANVDAGTRYLRELLLRYDGDVIKALAAYNAGPARVSQYKGVPPYRETRHYVARIVKEFNQKKTAASTTKTSKK